MKKNNSGIALIVTILLSFLALILIAGMLYMIINGTKLSGYGKQYATALDADKGGVNILTNIMNYDLTTPDLPANDYNIPNQTCFQTKLDTPTQYWNCNSSPDIIMRLGQYTVNATITSTQIILPKTPQGATYTYYSATVVSTSANHKETANISFVYKVQR
ncbi:MAG: hypothetical protein QXI16_07715 [Sulfolobaceae archaeon]